MSIWKSEDVRTIVATAQFLLGAALFVAPWLLGFAGESGPAWTAWASGGLIGLVGIINFADDQSWPSRANFLMGAWTLVAPWMIPFADSGAAVFSHLAVGLFVVLTSVWEISNSENRTPRVTA